MAKCPRSGAKFLWQGQVVTAVPAGHVRGHRSNVTCFKEGGETLAVVRMGAGHNRYYPPLKELKPLPEQLRVPPLMHVDRWRTESYGFPQPLAPGVNGIDETDTLRLYGSCVKRCRRSAPQTLGPCIDRCQAGGGQVGGTESALVRWEVFDEYGNSVLKGREKNRDTAEINAGVALRRLAARHGKRADQYSIRVGGGLAGTDDYHAHSASMWATNAVEEAELGAGDALNKGQCNRALESLVRTERKTTMASTNATQTGNERLKAKALASNTLVNALWREFQTKCIRRYPGDHPGSVLPFGGLGAVQIDPWVSGEHAIQTMAAYRVWQREFDAGRATAELLIMLRRRVQAFGGDDEAESFSNMAMAHVRLRRGEGVGGLGGADSLHERVAAVLGWSVKDTQGFSLSMLREMVRTKDPQLAQEISEVVQSGGHIRSLGETRYTLPDVE